MTEAYPELSPVELHVLKRCAEPEMTLGDGSDEQRNAFIRLEQLGLIAKNQEPANDFFWPTESGRLLLKNVSPE